MAEPRDEALRRRYRELATEEPSAAMDDALRAAARRAVSAGPGVRPRSVTRWAVPASVAAVLFLSFGVVMQMQEQVPPLEIEIAGPKVAQKPASPAPVVTPDAMQARVAGADNRVEEKKSVPASTVPAPPVKPKDAFVRSQSEAPAKQEQEKRRASEVERRDAAPPALAATAPAQAATAAAPPPPEPAKPEPRFAPNPTPLAMPAPAMPSAQTLAPGATAGLSQPIAVPPAVAERVAPAPILAPAAPPAPVAAAPSRAFADAASKPESFAAPKPDANVAPQREAAGGARQEAITSATRAKAAASPSLGMTGRLAKESDEAWPDTAEKKLERIEALRKAGRDREADEALARFRREHPDYRIPEATWERIRPR